MKTGIYIANFALDGNPQKFVELAQAAEESGWDGFFLWDHIYPEGGASKKVADPWIILAAIAANTEKMNIGTAVTPLPRRRPQKVARETVSLDILSGGRLVLGVGLGHPPENEFECFGEESDVHIRAEKLDESLEILEGLWSGKPFSYDGKHYHIEEITFKPCPVQQPRIPIWCASWFSRKAPVKRAARYDGVFPIGHDERMSPADFQEIFHYVNRHRTEETPFDMIMMGQRSGREDNSTWIEDYSDAGVTWYLEMVMEQDLENTLGKVGKGPPSVET
ncbi:MAG: LLM class flavin-dependent oxidoreductase [Candidatus Thorarchaeota archaeon]